MHTNMLGINVSWWNDVHQYLSHQNQQDAPIGSDQEESNRSVAREGTSSHSSSISLSSASVDEEFMQGLNFDHNPVDQGYMFDS